MAIEKLVVRKSASTLIGLVVSIVFAMAFFTGMYLWWQVNADDVGLSIDSKYNETYARLDNASLTLDDNIQDIKDGVTGIKEADNAWQVAWNGLKGLGNVLKLPVSFVSSAYDTVMALFIPLDFIPTWVKTLALITIIAGVVFLILSILKGDPNLT